jgi:segregation and condensation protein B
MELKFILEVLLFSAQKALSPAELRETLTAAAQEEGELVAAFKRTKEDEIVAALESLAADHDNAGRSFRLVCVAGAWQFVSKPEYAPWLRALVGHKARPPRLSQPALETLAIIAYRQPLTRSEIEQVRGVSVDGVMQTLLERGLIEATGRAEVVGRPMNYGTTPLFLEYFGLRSLEDLPAAEELRRMPVEKPPGLMTVEPGLATVPPADLTAPAVEVANSSAAVASSETPPVEPSAKTTPGATVP